MQQHKAAKSSTQHVIAYLLDKVDCLLAELVGRLAWTIGG